MSDTPNTGTPIEGEAGSSSQAPQGAPSYSDIELRALDMGWRPKEEYDGDPEDFVDAKEFVGRQKLFDKIDNTSKELKNTKKTLEAFKSHYQKVRETEYARAIADLKKQEREAKREGNHEIAVEIEEAREKIEIERDEFIEEQQQISEEAPVNPAFERWLERNDWYSNTKHMRVFADEIGTKLHNEGMKPEKVLIEVEKAVKKEFPNKFRNPNRDSAPSVEGPGTRAPTKGANDTSFMSEQDRQVMEKLVRDKVLTREEYIKDMKLQYGVK